MSLKVLCHAKRGELHDLNRPHQVIYEGHRFDKIIRDVSVEHQIDQQIAMQELSHELPDGAWNFYEFPGGEVSSRSWRCTSFKEDEPFLGKQFSKPCHWNLFVLQNNVILRNPQWLMCLSFKTF